MKKDKQREQDEYAIKIIKKHLFITDKSGFANWRCLNSQADIEYLKRWLEK